MQDVAVMEFRRGDGTSTTAELRVLTRYRRGDVIEHDGSKWVMYDRLDREGVTVHVFAPVSPVGASPAARGRRRGRPNAAAG
jgi:hypothetical protein